jgi:hypothetical protein
MLDRELGIIGPFLPVLSEIFTAAGEHNLTARHGPVLGYLMLIFVTGAVTRIKDREG